jgi:hypothetical protein
MRESFAHRHTCKACPDSRPGTGTLVVHSSLPVSRPCVFAHPIRTGRAPIARTCLIQPRPSCLSNGLSVSRAYLSPEKPSLEVNFRVLRGFLRVFWNGRNFGFWEKSICCGVYKFKPNRMRFPERRIGVSLNRVTEVLQTVRKYYIGGGSRWISRSWDGEVCRSTPRPFYARVTPGALQLRTNAPNRSKASGNLPAIFAKPSRKCEGASQQSPGASKMP